MTPESLHEGPQLAQRDAHMVIDCRHCGYAHLDPLPTETELVALYAERYYEEDNPGWLEKDRAEQAFWDLEHDDKLADWARLLGADGATIVDVGCSGGLLMERAVAQGWRAWGIEPSSIGVNECRRLGLEVVEGRYQDLDVEDAVDVVHAKLVLEHLTDPAGFVGWARRALRPGGVLTIHVPNEFTVLQREARDALGLESWWIAPPFHLNYFDFASLERLVTGGGLTVAGRDATYPMEWFLLAGENYVGDATLGASAHQRRMVLETGLEAIGERRPLHRHLADRGLGREAIVHARKPALP